MPELPVLSSRELIRALERDGWVRSRATSGSHQAYVKEFPDGRKRTVIVVEGKREIPRGTIRAILSRAQIDVEEFLKLLR